jgi:hypothetical protein
MGTAVVVVPVEMVALAETLEPAAVEPADPLLG